MFEAKQFDWREVLTPEIFKTWRREIQLSFIIFVDPDYLIWFKKFHGAPDVGEEIRLIHTGVIRLEDALHKNEFTGGQWVALAVEGIITPTEIARYFDCRRLSGSEWAELLATGPRDSSLDQYCDFAKLKGSDWVHLLTHQSAYAEHCPFELWEPEEIDKILQYQPQLAKQSGLISPIALVVCNDFPHTDRDSDIPFMLLPQNEFAREILAWLKNLPGMDEERIHLCAYQIIYRPVTLLGVYAAAYAETKKQQFQPGMERFMGLSLQLYKIDDFYRIANISDCIS